MQNSPTALAAGAIKQSGNCLCGFWFFLAWTEEKCLNQSQNVQRINTVKQVSVGFRLYCLKFYVDTFDRIW